MLHAIVEAAVREGFDDDPRAIVERARTILAPLPFPTERAAWLARTEAFATDFAAMQIERMRDVHRRWVEAKGRLDLPGHMSVRGKADRIDQLHDGTAVVVDYKSGTPPAPKQILHFDRQLLIEAAMLESGAFEDIPPIQVCEVMHIALRRAFEARPIDLRADAEFDPAKSLDGLVKLMSAYLAPDQGYSSRRAMEKMSYSGDYDHLARFGEWDVGDPPRTLGVR
jgi:ATP-dependent helicase/nuclease subunit B